MSLIKPLAAASELEGVLGHRPELLEKYRSFYQSFWQDGLVPRRVLELCRRRIAHIQSCAAELAIVDPQTPLTDDEERALARGEFTSFSAAEQAALAVAELMPNGVHFVTDQQVQRVAAELGNAGCVALLTALSFIDVNCRFKVILDTTVAAGEIDDGFIA